MGVSMGVSTGRCRHVGNELWGPANRQVSRPRVGKTSPVNLNNFFIDDTMWLSKLWKARGSSTHSTAARQGARMALYRTLNPKRKSRVEYWLPQYPHNLTAYQLIRMWLEDRPDSLTPAQLLHALTHMRAEDLTSVLRGMSGLEYTSSFPISGGREEQVTQRIDEAHRVLNPLIQDGTVYAARVVKSSWTSPVLLWDTRRTMSSAHTRAVHSILRSNFMAVLNWFWQGTRKWDEKLVSKKSTGQWWEGAALELYCQRRLSDSAIVWQINLHMTDTAAGLLVMSRTTPRKIKYAEYKSTY